MTDTEILDWIERQVLASPTGVSFDKAPACEGETGGIRFMRMHFLGERAKTLRAAVEKARGAENPSLPQSKPAPLPAIIREVPRNFGGLVDVYEGEKWLRCEQREEKPAPLPAHLEASRGPGQEDPFAL